MGLSSRQWEKESNQQDSSQKSNIQDRPKEHLHACDVWGILTGSSFSSKLQFTYSKLKVTQYIPEL